MLYDMSYKNLSKLISLGENISVIWLCIFSYKSILFSLFVVKIYPFDVFVFVMLLLQIPRIFCRG